MSAMQASALLLGAALLAPPAFGGEAPPREFWLYFAAFGNARGEVFDPADLAAAEIAAQPAAKPPASGADDATATTPGAKPVEEVKKP